MTAPQSAPAAGDTSGRPARPERGERAADSVLSLTTGAGPKQLEDCMASQRRPDQPVRFDDPARNAAYWERIRRNVDAAPPLDDAQRAVIRTAFSQPAAREAA